MIAKKTRPVLNVKTENVFSEKIEDPVVIEPQDTITLEFSDELDEKTIHDGIKIYKVKSSLKEDDVDVNVRINKNAPNTVSISSSDDSLFEEGYLFRISLGEGLKSVGGASLNQELNGYFAVEYPLKLDSDGSTESNSTRSRILCISDLHLGVNDSYSELTRNRKFLVDFLDRVKVSPDIKELVIAGDLIDEWFHPMEIDTFNGGTQQDFVKSLALNNKEVFDAFNSIIEDGKIKVTYVPGNHDLLINSENIQSIMPGISEVRDVKGLGVYSPEGFPMMAIEHGHRYNFYCAPDYTNKYVTQTDSILPPGYFFTRMAVTSVIQGRPKIDPKFPTVKPNDLGTEQYNYFLYWNVWKGLISDFPIKQGLDAQIIKTNIDGYTHNYAIGDVLPSQDPDNGYIFPKLYKGIIESWEDRQEKNMVPVKIPVEEAVLKGAFASHLDDQSMLQFFNNPQSDKRIVIFGHSHEARVITSFNEKLEKNVYVNSGTWIDSNSCSMTFVSITPPKDDDTNTVFINLCQYTEDGEVKKLTSEAMSKS